MTKKTGILVCDDHPLFRAGVVSCFAGRPDLEVVAEAADGAACIAKLELFAPDILIADLSMPQIDGFRILEWVGESRLATRVYILSMHTELAYVRRARSLGAAGFLAKEDTQSVLLAAIDQTRDDFYTSSSIGRPSDAGELSPADENFRALLRSVSKAEMRVLQLLTENLTSREIAERLKLSVRTVQAHRIRLVEIFGVRGSNKLLGLAIRNAATIRSYRNNG